ncbi:MAG: DUF115 domain-containing protein [Eubacteriales bacterium]|nr:DUF115 domain-containing protein [Eubacteriales bacterium]
MSIREKNLACIEKKNKNLYDAIIKYDEKAEKNNSVVSVQQSMDGSDILCVEEDGMLTPLNSIYDPVEEANYYVRKYEKLPSHAIMIFFGLGNGVHARAVMNMSQKDIAAFFYEPSVDIFLKTIEHFDITDLLEDERTEIFVGSLNGSELELYLEANLTHENVAISYIESLPKYKKLFGKEYVELFHIYQDRARIMQMDINTRLKVKEEFMVNPLKNLEYTFHCKSAWDYKKVFTEDMPAILVAAGPSLEKNVEQLKKAKGKAFILAVDTAALYLLNRGIEPDMVAAIDYLKPLRLFDDDRLKDIPLVMLTDFNHKVMERLDGNDFVFGSSSLGLYRNYFQNMGNKIEGLPQGGSVATYGFALLQYWGFKKVMLVGQDLAHTGDKQHAGEAEIKREEIKREIIELEGNVEEKVYTTLDYYAYLRWFEMAIAHYYPNSEVINATEGGAKIRGTQIMTLKEAMDLYCEKEYDFGKLCKSVPFVVDEDHYQEAYAYLNNQKNEIKKLKRTLKSAMHNAERAQVLVERGETFGKEFKKLNKDLTKACKEYEETDTAQLVSALCADVEIASVVDLYIEKDDQIEEMKRLYEKLHGNYKSYYNHVDDIVNVFEEVLENIATRYQMDKE